MSEGSIALEIVRGLAQAAANAYDGAHDERFTVGGETKSMGLRREEGCPINDSRALDGFKVKFYGDSLCISYQADIKLKEVYAGKFESKITKQLNDIKKYLQKEYKAITGKSVTLTAKDEPQILVQSTSRVRSWVQAKQHFKIGQLPSEPILSPSEDRVTKAIRDFLSQHSTKRPKNEKIKK